MKKKFTLLFLCLSSLSIHLNAQIDTEDTGSVNISPPLAVEEGAPFKFAISGDYIGSAKVEKPSRFGELTFATCQIELNTVFYYDECFKEGASIALAYQQTYLNWNENPYFSQNYFDVLNVILSTYTERLNDWQWRAQISVNFDDLPYWDFSDYMTYDFVSWGRYEWSEVVGIHMGFWAQAGMKLDRVYPILGFDWQINNDWKLNIVYPVNISAVYTINGDWNIALAGRFIDQRHRAKENEAVSQAIWHYQGCGAEIAANYAPNKSFSANIHAGCFLGGHLKIATKHYHRLERLRIGSAPYAGGEIVYHF